jgi:NAD(P)-dependent dehydrogenase (short-subunit alcohol dehydrogenase family)
MGTRETETPTPAEPTPAEPVLQGQVAVVTGASRGIGRAVAARLAAEGANVALLARSHHEVAEAASALSRGGVRALGLRADVTRGEEVDAAFQEVSDRLGPPTLLVNNAGLFSAVGPLWEVDPEAWWRDVEVSLRGTFLCSRAALRSMIPAGRGRILNMTSLAGTRPSPHATAYACAKAGVFRLTEGLAEEAASHGVQVFSIGPGFVRTAMTKGVLETGWLPEMQAVPPDAWVGPERVAGLVVLVATGRADALSGRFLFALDDIEDLIRRAEEIRREDLYTVRLRR